ncbi:SdiA-regulated domain-containing protein [Sphingomicrobium nitratireducens]|uniref:SdiA-regulated domain-containing protein n=1 Tax=Sphingomicrobium nitratireducens TaxID=2964666 RepID=UPI0022400C67|nr:SdiA-regulated domain-containing protein [Sphingomicrobium nitratireducens]
MRRALLWLPIALALGLSGCDLKPRDRVQITLPATLKEVSGLAVAGPNSVFTHNDEHAIVFEVDIRRGRTLRVFALGDPTIEGDFEGIAAAGDLLFLITSDGLLYETRPGRHGDRVDYRVFDTGIGPRCEIEGLSQAPERDHLLILCKRFRGDEGAKRLDIYRWAIGGQRRLETETPWLSVPLDAIMPEDQQDGFRPSGLEWDASTGRLLIVSARDRMMVAIDEKGEPVATVRLAAGRHPHTEGIAVMPDGRVVLADEGSDTRKGRLSVYERQVFSSLPSSDSSLEISSKKSSR